MRIYALWLFIVTLGLYAWRDWYLPLCGLIPLTTLLQRRDMPSKIAGIQGLGPWNILFFSIVLAWLLNRRPHGLRWDLPRAATAVLGAYAAMIAVAYLRAVVDLDSFPPPYEQTVLGFTSEELINRFKYLLLGVLMFEGCRDRRRLLIGLLVALSTVLIYALFTLKFIPPSVLVEEESFMRYRYRFDRDIGLNPIDLSMVLAGGFWGIAGLWGLSRRISVRAAVVAVLLVTAVALGLTHSRGGYLGFVATALVVAAARWRFVLILLPIGAVAAWSVTNIPERLLSGFQEVNVTGDAETNLDMVSSGRTTELWPPTLEEIGHAPLIGQGRRAFLRSQIPNELMNTGITVPEHPHNAYLEILLDSGLVGLVIVMVLLLGMGWLSWRVFRAARDPLLVALGAAGLAATATLMVTGIACQTFFPAQSTVGHWCLWGLVCRVAVDAGFFGEPAAHPCWRPTVAAGPPGISRASTGRIA